MPFEANKTIKELGINPKRKFRVVSGEDDMASIGDILELNKDDDTDVPFFNNLSRTGEAKFAFFLRDLEYADEDNSHDYKFKVGDRVRATAGSMKGRCGEVVCVDEEDSSHTYMIKFEDGSGQSRYWMRNGHLELVEEEPVPKFTKKDLELMLTTGLQKIWTDEFGNYYQSWYSSSTDTLTNKTNNKTMSWTNFWEGLSTQVKKQFKPYKEQLQYGLRHSDLSLTDKAVQVLLEAYAETKEGKEALQEVIDERKAEEKKNK